MITPEIKILYKVALVDKRRILVWRSKWHPNCFRVKYDAKPGERTAVFLCPESISKQFCAKLWDWELWPKQTLYI